MRSQTVQLDSESKLDQRSPNDGDDGASLSIGDVAQMLGRHKWFIIVCAVVCLAVSVLYAETATKVYEASASMRIDPTRAGSLGLNDLVSGGMGDTSEQVATEMAILKSDAVAIETLHSVSDEDFQQFAHASKASLGIDPGATSLTPQQESVLGQFKSSLTTRQVEGTQIVVVSFRNPNPKIAALMVNRTIASYLKQTFDSRYGSVAQVSKWLSESMDTLRDKASVAQQRLADFQEKNDILGTDSGPSTATSGAGSNTTTDRLRLLNTSLANAQAERIVKEAQMRAASTGNPAVLANLFPNASLGALQNEQSRLYAQYAQLSTKFGANYPPLIELRNDMKKVDDQVAHQLGTITDHLKQDYDAAATTEKMLQTEYDAQTEKAYALNRKQAEYAVLKAEGTSSRELYNTLQYKLQQAGVDAGLNAVNTMLVDSARAPLIPIEPKKVTIVSFGALLGLFVGVGSSFLREALSDRVQSIEQVERALGFPLLATVPHINAGQAPPPGANHAVPGMLVTYSDQLSKEAESYRSLRNAVMLSSLDKPAKTILVTSTLPSEGKSNTASNFAVVLAQNGAKVLIIDADLRRPTLHMRFGVQENGLGLSDVLLETVTTEPFLHPLPGLENLHLMTAGEKVALPSELLSSNKFYNLLKRWEGEFDFIVIDSAPLLVVSDSLPLASWVDALVLVTRYNVTPIGALKRIRDILNRTNANVSGVIINDMLGARDDYGRYGYGYGYYNQ